MKSRLFNMIFKLESDEIGKSYRIVTGLILGSLLNDILAIHCRFCASKRINMRIGMTELCFVSSFSNRKIQNEFRL